MKFILTSFFLILFSAYSTAQTQDINSTKLVNMVKILKKEKNFRLTYLKCEYDKISYCAEEFIRKSHHQYTGTEDDNGFINSSIDKIISSTEFPNDIYTVFKKFGLSDNTVKEIKNKKSYLELVKFEGRVYSEEDADSFTPPSFVTALAIMDIETKEIIYIDDK